MQTLKETQKNANQFGNLSNFSYLACECSQKEYIVNIKYPYWARLCAICIHIDHINIFLQQCLKDWPPQYLKE